MRFLWKAPIPQETLLELADGPLRVRVRVSARARAYRLALSARGEAVLTVPAGGQWAQAEQFLFDHRAWLETQLAKALPPVPFAAGALIPVRDVPHRIAAMGGLRGTARLVAGVSGPEIAVPGAPEHLARRVLDCLKREARADLEAACARHARTLGVRVAALRLKDQSTRWGSCSSARTLNFNWRLVLAPPHVLDYVAAHEVAHILEMNHAPAFWRTVGRALPDYEAGKDWLKEHGAGLMRIGVEPGGR